MSDLILSRASFTPSTINAENRTVEVVWSTGATLPHHGMLIELSMDPAHVRLGRLQSGTAPVLAAHNADELAAVIGVVETARIENGQGIARLRFAKDDPAADAAWNKIQQGILRNVSLGAKVHKTEPRGNGAERAIDWEPYEISIVPMGADAGAVMRTAYNKENTVNETTPETVTTTPTPADLERERAATITHIVRTAHLESALAEDMIRSGATLDTARATVLERLVEHQERMGGPGNVPGGAPVTGTRGMTHDDFRAAAADGLLLRAGITLAKPHAAARDFHATSVHEIARTCLSRTGARHGNLSDLSLIQRAMTTSDFPEILADSVGKALRRGWETEPASHRAWVRTQRVRNFKDQLRPILGSAPSLEPVLEHGEYTEGAMDEDSTSYRVGKFGRIVALSWETLVNDDLGAFLRVQPALGQAARRLEADTVYALFALNGGAGPTMQDTVSLFDNAHANVTSSGSTLDAPLLGAGRTLLRKQTAVGGGYLSLVPRYLIVPAEHEDEAERLIAAAGRMIVASTDDTVTRWIANLDMVVEPRLASGAVYLAASAEQIDTVELGMLEENMDGPMIQEDREFLRDIIRWKVRHVFGAKFLDWRGVVKMPIGE